jgi:hypothetical protein
LASSGVADLFGEVGKARRRSEKRDAVRLVPGRQAVSTGVAGADGREDEHANDANCACFIANCHLRMEAVGIYALFSPISLPFTLGLAVAQLPLLLKGKARAST